MLARMDFVSYSDLFNNKKIFHLFLENPGIIQRYGIIVSYSDIIYFLYDRILLPPATATERADGKAKLSARSLSYSHNNTFLYSSSHQRNRFLTNQPPTKPRHHRSHTPRHPE